jgi:hypothetical protein
MSQTATIKRPRFVARSSSRTALMIFSFIALVLLGSAWLFFDNFVQKRAPQSPHIESRSTIKTQETSSIGISSTVNNQKKSSSFTLIEDDSGKGLKTSAAHCSLSTMNEKAWMGAMCSFKYLCYHPNDKQFIFHRAIEEIPPPPHELNLGKLTKFYPKIEKDKLPLPRYEASTNETWVIMEMNENSYSTLEDFLRDDLFAWWLLAQHATWTTKTIVRPLQLNFDRELTPQMLAWYRALPFSRLTVEKELAEYKHPVCFPKAVIGLGSMTDHCVAPDHDYHEIIKPEMGVGVEAIPCPTGRGPLFYRLREEMIFRLSGVLPENQQRKKPKDEPHVVLFAENSDSASSFEKLEQEALQQFNGKNIQVKRVCTSCLTPKEQLELALTVSVLVTSNVGPQSLIAHFLRRGAGVVLAENEPYKHTNFGIWNNLAYIRARWVKKEKDIQQAIQIELEKCEHFM